MPDSLPPSVPPSRAALAAAEDAANDTLAEIAASGALISSGGYSASVTITRPSNTTAYAAGDVIGAADSGTPANAGSAVLEFQNIGPKGGHILLTCCDLMIASSAIPSGMTSFRLHLYGAAPTAILDNAAWDLVAADRPNYRGFIDFGSPSDFGSTLWAQPDPANRHIKLADEATSLFGLLVPNGAYTPTSGTVYTPRVRSIGL